TRGCYTGMNLRHMCRAFAPHAASLAPPTIAPAREPAHSLRSFTQTGGRDDADAVPQPPEPLDPAALAPRGARRAVRGEAHEPRGRRPEEARVPQAQPEPARPHPDPP